MKITFKTISGRGFMTFREPFTFSFSDYEGKRVFIQGDNRDEPLALSNGAGKSNLLEALTYLLFGRLSKRIRYLSNIVNQESEDCQVEGEFSVDFGNFFVERGRTGKSSYLRIFQEGQEILQDADSADKQAELERILGLSFLSYSHSVTFCQNFKAFTDLKAPERATLLTELSGAGGYVQAQANSKKEADQLGVQVKALIVRRGQIEELLETIKATDYEKLYEEWEAELDEAIEGVKAGVVEHQTKLDHYRKTRQTTENRLKDEIASLEQKIDLHNKIILDSYTGLDQQLEDTRINMFRTQTGKEHIQKNINTLAKKLQEVRDRQMGICSYCNQEITADSIDRHVRELQKEIKDLQHSLHQKNTELAEALENIRFLDQERVDRNSMEESVKGFDKELKTVRENLEALQRREKENFHEKMLTEKSKQLQELEEKVNPYYTLREKQAQDIQEKEHALEALNKSIQKLEDEQSYPIWWQEHYGRLRMMLFDDVVARLEELTLEWLSRFSTLLDIRIKTERDTQSGNTRDEVNVQVGDTEFEGFGGGEKQKVRLALSLALSQVITEKSGKEFNLVIFDEPNNGMDTVGKESNSEAFKILAEMGKTVLVVDHDDFFTDRMDATVLVRKEGGTSEIIPV